MSRITPYLFLGLIASGAAFYVLQDALEPTTQQPAGGTKDALQSAAIPYTHARSLSGAYLAGRYAQRSYDWRAAERFLEQVSERNPKDTGLMRRLMVLSMGSGEPEKAIDIARDIAAIEGAPSALTELFMAAGDFRNKNYEGAAAHIDKMPPGGLSDFILPLLKSWAAAALGRNETDGMGGNTVHLYHAVLINDFLGQPERVEQMLMRALNTSELGAEDIVRLADLWAHIGNKEHARKLYEEARDLAPHEAEIAEKLEALDKDGKAVSLARITSAEEGAAEALFDMGRLLAQEHSDESARVFLQISVFLNPETSKARFLLAGLAARNDRPQEAIDIYRTVPATDENYNLARRNAAELLGEMGLKDEALAELKDLAENHKDVEAMIQIGDSYRADEEFSKAIRAYDAAQDMLGGTIGAQYWQLHYLRGMAYEQSGQWDKAEKDLKAALAFQPSHPYILNYLGYAWADQGVNLKEALDMIERAVIAQPDDGYITDSLGWVYYKMGQFEAAVPYLERAVELMPYDSTVNDHLGDAYWNVGRLREARFQWERAKNHAEDAESAKAIEKKIAEGMDKSLVPQPAHIMAEDVAPQAESAHGIGQ